MPCAAPPRSHSSEPSSAPCSSRSPPSSSSLPSSSAASLTESDKALSVLLGYSLGAAVVLPLDRLKSLMQVDEGARRAGAFGLARRIVRSNGVRGLYQGGGAHMLIAPYTIFYYLLYDGLQMRGRELTATPATREGHHLVPLGAALAARTAEVTVRMPLELVRTRMQASRGGLTLTDCVASLRAQPISGWFRGLVPTLGRDVPFSGLYWWSYEIIRRRLHSLHLLQEKTLTTAFISGALSGTLAALVVTPVDVLKTVRQHQAVGASYVSIIGAVRAAPQRAFAGVLPRLVRVPAGMAAMMTGIEGSKWVLAERRRSELC